MMAPVMAGSIPELPEAVLFDVGDTLVPATRIAEEALAAAAEWLGQRRRDLEVKTFMDTYREVDSQYDDPSTNHLWGLPLDIMIRACSTFGLGRGAALAAGSVYRQEVRRRIVPDPGMVMVLSELRAQGIRLGILSNGTTIEQLDTLILLGVIDLLDSFAISEDYGWLKPDPRLTRVALQDLSARPERTWMVGDDPKSDGEAARAAGMVWVRVGQGDGHGDLNITGVAELGTVLRARRAETA
jgi:putative hydrolase of the HAD superfamily